MTMNRIVLCLLVAGSLSACASNRDRPDPGMSGYDRAGYALHTGDYATAHEGFSCIATRGPGYEVAQHNAGLASLGMAGMPGMPADEAARLEARGLEELTIAARAGWPASQAELVQRFVEKGDADSLNMAAFWLWNYAANNRETALGIRRLSEAERSRYASLIGEEIMQAAYADAQVFRTVPLPTAATTPSCTPWFAQADPTRQRRRPPQDTTSPGSQQPGQPGYPGTGY